jgi:hypothetical protein
MILESKGIIEMPRAALLSVIGLAAAAMVTPASAADLPEHSRIGAIFAQPVPRHRVEIVREREKHYPQSALYRFRIPPPVPGYYGRPNDFYYRPYYEDRSAISYYFGRLPYACRLSGYC